MKKPHWLEKEELYNIMFESDSRLGRIFDITLIIAISLSIIISFVETVPSLASTFKLVLEILEYLLTFFFTVEYIARVYCSPQPREYVLSFFGVIDLLSILPPYLSYFLPNARYMILLRSFRFIRIFRIFKLFSFINEGYMLMRSLQKSLTKIAVYFLFVLILDICLGTLMFMVENSQPNTQFTDLATSVYWAIVTMTTVGYGDITPVTSIGRLLSAFVMLLGYTIIAVPTGIVTANIIDEVKEKPKDGHCPRCGALVRDEDRYCSHCGEKL
ncbi:MAG: ion transporter [Prevotella sp.]|nr:ion transporter [Prevotella sp.]